MRTLLYADCFCNPQVLTGIIPYEDLSEDIIPLSVVTGERPRRPANITNTLLSDPVWTMLEDCWSESQGMRWDARCMRRRFCDPQGVRAEGIPCIGEGRWQVTFLAGDPLIQLPTDHHHPWVFSG